MLIKNYEIIRIIRITFKKTFHFELLHVMDNLTLVLGSDCNTQILKRIAAIGYITQNFE